jgi:O-Antigen ligase
MIHSHNDISFKGIWLQLNTLTQSEKVVCLGILLIPLWWITGWGLILLAWVIGIAIYELYKYRKIRLSRPNLSVIALIFFSFYQSFTYVINSPEIAPRILINPPITWGSAGLLLWYIQTNNIRVRLQVVAWAFSFAICMMLGLWLFCHFVLSEPYYIPPRTLYALILDKGNYDPSRSGSVGNFLVPYSLAERGFAGLSRYNFFFPHSTVSSFAIGFAGLIVLDLKNRLWSFPIVIVCGFLIVIAQARNAWLALSLVLLLRLLITSAKTRGLAFILMLFATMSFFTFSLPPMTSYISETYTNAVETTTKFRKESTDDRQKVYIRTWESFLEEPLVGHGVNGPPVTPGYDFARIGTESFILGTLLYRSGLIGTLFFLTFFISFLIWLYKTRKNRPLSSFLMLAYLSLSSLVTEFIGPEIFIILLCGIIYKSKSYQLKKERAYA